MSNDSYDKAIVIKGASTHNLKNVDLTIPHNKLIAFTGVSGSGKSALAFDTINAEAQRRYLESISPYARRLLHQAITPRVAYINGLPPAVALRQQQAAASTRSNVGTITAASNTLRMLLSRAGTYPKGMDRLDSDAFSANTHAGACSKCHGIGKRYDVTEQSLVHNPSLSIEEKAVTAWPGAWQGKNQRDILKVLGYDVKAPWNTLSKADRDWILFTEEQPVVTVDPVREVGRIQRPYKGQYMSAKRYILKALTMSHSAQQRKRALEFVIELPCEHCLGTRLNPDSLRVTYAGMSIAQLTNLPIDKLAEVIENKLAKESSDETISLLSNDLLERLHTIKQLGLSYLPLDRPTTELSTGEIQRLRLSAQLKSGLFGVLYILDEPAASLHPADTEPLLKLLKNLREAGNTVIIVEHNLGLALQSDWLIDIGPGAGTYGGEITYSGKPCELKNSKTSATGKWLKEKKLTTYTERVLTDNWVHLENVSENNLKDIDVRIPLKLFTTITGVSGSGKTTLAMSVLQKEVQKLIDTNSTIIKRIVCIDQRPIGRNSRSNLATYTGVFTEIRKLFCEAPLAKKRGYKPNRFSFNVDGGRCPNCNGDGDIKVELMLLPSTTRPCEVCNGSRYKAETLEAKWQNYTIADVLDLTVNEALNVFTEHPPTLLPFTLLRDLGLGYLKLGQPATQLSGGEAQRIKLATELQKNKRSHTLYLFDEPTTGLHVKDTDLLITHLKKLATTGHSVVVIEHNMRVVASSNYVIDLGPGGGVYGGEIIACGTPEQLAKNTRSVTARYLASELATTL